jgi:gliding motility-associated-like protein
MLRSLVRRQGGAFWEHKISFFLLSVQRNWQRSLLVVIAAVATPAFTLAQSNPGVILGSQCITAGATPTAFTSIRNADLSGGLTISWEKSVDLAFTVPIPIGGATGQTYAEGVVLATTYYRRVISSTPVSYSNIITVTVVGAVANPTFSPQVPPFPIICQQTTSFPVNYTTTGTPNRYSIFWDAAAVAAGFVDAINVVLGATPGNITVNVPAGAAASVYNGTLIAVNTGNGCTVSNASSVLINPLPVITGTLSACVNATTALNGSGTAAAVNPWISSNTAVATVDNIGVVTAVSPGTSIITYTNNNGCQQTATVTINGLPAITGTLNTCINATTALNGSGTAAAVNPWVSSNTAVATVNNTGLVTGVSAGTSIITYTNNNGCQQTATVTVNALPTIGGILVACANATTSLTGSGTAAAVTPWASSNTGVATVDNAGLVTAVSGGSSIITYTNNNGCQQTATVTVNALPTIGGTLNVCVGSTTSLTGSGTAAAATPWISSNTGVATVDNAGLVTAVSGGSSIITYTNNNGCQQTATVTVNALPTIGGTLNVCVGSTTSLTGSGTAAAATPWISSNTGVATVNNTGVVTGVSGGTVIITYTNNNGCQQTATVTVNALPTIGGTLNVCVGSTTSLTGSGTAAAATPWISSNTGVATVNNTGVVTGVSGGTVIITYTNNNGCQQTATVTVNALPTIGGTLNVCVGSTTSLTGSGTAAAATPWISSNTGVATVNNTGVVTGVSGGTVIITYTNNNGCQQTATVTVNALPTIGGTLNVCVGLTTSLTGSGIAAAVNPWTSSNTGVATVNSTGVVTGVSGGTAIITYTNNNGCQQTATVTVNALPTIGGTLNVCVGSTTSLTGAGTAAAVTPWISSNTGVATVNSTGVVTGVSGGTAIITYTNNNGCQQTATVTVNALPTIGGTLNVCVGSTTSLTGSGTAAAATPWISSNTGVATVNNTGVVTGVSGGTVIITYTNNNGCQQTATVTVNALPTIGGTLNVCVGLTTSLTGSGTAAAVTPWISSNTGVATVNSTGVVTGVSGGTAVITYTNNNGCQQTATVTVNALPTIGGTLNVCVGLTTSLTGSGTAAAVTPWISSNTGVATVNSIGVVTGVSGGTAVITYTNNNGCQQTATVTVNALPTIGGTLNVCVGSTTSLTGSGTAAATNPWTSSNTTVATINNTGVVTGLSAGTGIVTYINNSGCQQTVTVTINPLPTVAIGAGGPTTFCIGRSVILTSSSGSSYLWNSGQTTQSISVNNTGTRTVTMTDANGCSATSPVTSVTVNPLPTVSIIAGGPLTFCSGGSVTLNSSAGSSYVWNSGETTQSISVNSTGTRTVTITDGNGCSATSSVTSVTVNPLPVVNAITGSNAVCTGSTIALANTTPGGIWSSSVSTIAVIGSSGVLTAVSAGTTNVSYTVTDANNCTASVSSSKTVNPLPSMTITNPAAVCAPAAVDITQPFITAGSDPAADLSYWTDATATNLFITPNAASNPGTYYIKGTLPATGCSSIRSVIVTVNSLPSFSINHPAAVCEPATVDITAAGITKGTASALTLSYWRNQTATTALAAPASLTVSGTYYIKGVAVTGCAVVLPVSVTVNPLPNGSLQIPAVSFICDGTPLTLTASDAFAYQWLNNQLPIGGAVAAVYTASVAGNYSVQFSSVAGCKKNSGNTITLSLFVKPVIGFNAGGRCITSPVNFTNNSLFANSGTINWLWNFDDGSFSNNISVSHSYLQADSYNVLLTANNVSCPAFTDSATTTLNIEAPATAVRYDTVFAVNGKPFVLSAREIGSVYQWRPSTGLSSAVVRTPTATLTTDASYTVSITSSAGCIATDTVFVKLKNDGEIYVAQGFTPNGDGLNDRAYPILVGVKQLVYFKIFNRWGNLLFQTNDETPQNGWDGKYQGRMQQAGTYTWIAEVIDGNGKVIQKKGSLLLVN